MFLFHLVTNFHGIFLAFVYFLTKRFSVYKLIILVEVGISEIDHLVIILFHILTFNMTAAEKLLSEFLSIIIRLHSPAQPRTFLQLQNVHDFLLHS